MLYRRGNTLRAVPLTNGNNVLPHAGIVFYTRKQVSETRVWLAQELAKVGRKLDEFTFVFQGR